MLPFRYEALKKTGYFEKEEVQEMLSQEIDAVSMKSEKELLLGLKEKVRMQNELAQLLREEQRLRDQLAKQLEIRALFTKYARDDEDRLSEESPSTEELAQQMLYQAQEELGRCNAEITTSLSEIRSSVENLVKAHGLKGEEAKLLSNISLEEYKENDIRCIRSLNRLHERHFVEGPSRMVEKHIDDSVPVHRLDDPASEAFQGRDQRQYLDQKTELRRLRQSAEVCITVPLLTAKHFSKIHILPYIVFRMASVV